MLFLFSLLLVNEEGIIIEWNVAMSELTKVDSEDALNKSFWDVYGPLLPSHLRDYESTTILASRFRDLLSKGEATWIGRPIGTEMFVRGKHKDIVL